MLDKSDFDQWKDSIFTQALFKELKALREDYKDRLARGAYLFREGRRDELQQIAMAVGIVTALNSVLDVSYKEEKVTIEGI